MGYMFIDVYPKDVKYRQLVPMLAKLLETVCWILLIWQDRSEMKHFSVNLPKFSSLLDFFTSVISVAD